MHKKAVQQAEVDQEILAAGNQSSKPRWRLVRGEEKEYLKSTNTLAPTPKASQVNPVEPMLDPCVTRIISVLLSLLPV